MIQHGTTYELQKQIDMVDQNHLQVVDKPDQLTIAQSTVLENLHKAYNKNAHGYNLRSKSRTFQIGQNVFVRNFTLSKAIDKYAAKFAPIFIKGTIIKPVGTVAYEVMDENNKNLGVYHVKDIKC